MGVDALIRAGVVIRLNEALALLRSPQALMTPAFVLRVLRAAPRGSREASDTREAAVR
jgi:hypothetical protein